MNIDIEDLVREEIRNLIREQLNIGKVVKEYREITKPAIFQTEEKGEVKAKLHMDDSAENEAKEEAIKKARIDKIASEGMAAANKELAEEAQNTEGVEVKEEKIMDSVASDEAKIPKTGDLPMINPSLFTKSND